jgi:hypothetical protein
MGVTTNPGVYKANIYDLAPFDVASINQFTGEFLIYYELQTTI